MGFIGTDTFSAGCGFTSAISGVKPSYEMPRMPTLPLHAGIFFTSQSIVSKLSVIGLNCAGVSLGSVAATAGGGAWATEGLATMRAARMGASKVSARTQQSVFIGIPQEAWNEGGLYPESLRSPVSRCGSETVPGEGELREGAVKCT